MSPIDLTFIDSSLKLRGSGVVFSSVAHEEELRVDDRVEIKQPHSEHLGKFGHEGAVLQNQAPHT